MSRVPHASQLEADSPIHRIFYKSQSDTVRLGRRIGAGAEGEVYEIQAKSDLVAKIYHEPPPPEKAEKLVILSRLGNERLFNLSAWPVSTLRDAPDGEIVGFVMKKISQAEEVHALHSPKSRLQKFPEASWAFLIYVAANIARAVAAIHEHGLVIGDVNPKNILVTSKATVYLLDVDSFQVSAEGKTYRCEGGFPEYTPPELQGVAFRDIDRAQEHDSFGLGVVIFQLLFMGRHPFSGRYFGAGEMPLERAIREFRFAYGVDAEAREMRQPPGTLALESMPAQFVSLFRRAFLSTDRPGPREWIEPLEELAKALKKCELHNGHYYYRGAPDCPWCGIESQARVRLFNFLLPGDDSRRGHFRLDEIWKEIVRVEAPDASLIRWVKTSEPAAPSAEVAAFAEARDNRLSVALIFSAFAGLGIGSLVSFPLALIPLILAGLIIWAFTKASALLIESVQARWRHAKEKAQSLQEQYDLELGNERWDAKRDELKNRKETYENLAQIRHLRLQQLEADARKNQLDEFLDQFEIYDAKIIGISHTVKTSLLSHGVETAADLGEINELKQIPSIGSSRAQWLLEWRKGLEQKFVFDPTKGVTPEARFRTERDVDALRFRLENELSQGARHLRRMKLKIETNRGKLQPALAKAKFELAQAEMDLEVMRKSSLFVLCLIALVVMLIIGSAVKESNDTAPPPEHVSRPGLVGPAPADSRPMEKALRLSSDGAQLSNEGRFDEAVAALWEAVRIDPKDYDSYIRLGYALYRLKIYDESVEASEKAIKLRRGFEPYYNSGLAYMELERWDKARMAFESATEHINIYSWEERYTLAYYHLGRSTTRLGEAGQMIVSVEDILKYNPKGTLKLLQLGSLYLWVGKREAARAQYRILKDADPALAEELLKLIEKHGKPA
jgi:DNA-binding helix-hairpin-helix protein with protein kinase domain/Tfp pilus assembly protein PilF